MKVYGFIVDGGDGSSSVSWYREMPDEERLESSGMFDYYNDGDGLTHRETLTFESEEAAVAAGIVFSDWDYEEE